MTIDEAIRHCEEVAELHEERCRFYEDHNMLEYIRGARELASEYRQLAEWLKELKALSENEEVKEVFKDCDTCKYLSLEADDYPCDRCCHRYINQYVYDNKREVNANGDSN